MALTMRKLNVGPKSEILRITRINLTSERLVYVLVANKQFSYTHGKSLIVYIATTRKGIKRIGHISSRAVWSLTLPLTLSWAFDRANVAER